MLDKRKKTLRSEVDALWVEVHELRRLVEGEPAKKFQGSSPLPGGLLPGEGEVIEMVVDQATEIADERDDLARQLEDAKRQLAEMEEQKRAES